MAFTMRKKAMRWGRGLGAALVTLFVFGTISPAPAALLQIQFSGLDLVYDGTSIFDAGGSAGGSGDRATADPLSFMEFFVDGSSVGELFAPDIWADIHLTPVSPLPANGVTAGTGEFFDLFTKNADPGWGLALDTVAYIITTDSLTGTLNVLGSGLLNSIVEQDLPFGLTIGQPVTWAFAVATNTFSSDSDLLLNPFNAAGTGSVNGLTVVPEPATLALLALGLIGVAGFARRRAL